MKREDGDYSFFVVTGHWAKELFGEPHGCMLLFILGLTALLILGVLFGVVPTEDTSKQQLKRFEIRYAECIALETLPPDACAVYAKEE